VQLRDCRIAELEAKLANVYKGRKQEASGVHADVCLLVDTERSVGNFAGDVNFGGLGLWLNPTSCAVLPSMSTRIERNFPSLYNFNSCFLVRMLLCWSDDMPFLFLNCFLAKINLFKGSVGRLFCSGGGLLLSCSNARIQCHQL
jgi:hypothetical protein